MSTTAGEEGQGTRTRVLVVDDSEICREVARIVLEASGYEVLEADTPFKLITTILQHRPALVLLDVHMPALRGDTAIGIARKHGLDDCTFLLFSDQPERDLEELVRSSGADGYVAKSFDPDALVEAVGRHLRVARPQAATE